MDHLHRGWRHGRNRLWQRGISNAARRTSQPKFLQIERHLAPRLVTLGFVLGHGAGNQVIDFGRKLGVECGRGHRLAVHYLERHGGRAVSLKWPVTGQHGVQNYAYCEQVGAAIDLLAFQLFRSHIGGSSKRVSVHGEVSEIQLGDAEISDFGTPVRGHKNVSGLYVAVHHPLGVCIVEGFG